MTGISQGEEPGLETIVPGFAQGEIVWSDVPLSFWGGVDPATGVVIDRHHPLCGTALGGRILALPQSRGSCTGSAVLLELALGGTAPAAILVSEPEEVLALGSVVAEAVFGKAVPLYRVDRDTFGALARHRHATIGPDGLAATLSRSETGDEAGIVVSLRAAEPPPLRLADRDRAMLAGGEGRARQVAMELLVRMAAIQGATALIDVTQVHVDGCCYNGPAGLAFAQMFVGWGGQVAVPTTLNAISVDKRHWRGLGIDPGFGEPAEALADSYMALGASPTFTCAPYLLASAPSLGEQVGWGESNAVCYANSVLGARTLKYPDHLDLCVALTGRAPRIGCHLDEGRRATLGLAVPCPAHRDDSFWPLLGYWCGTLSRGRIPLVTGLEDSQPSLDDLKAFAAAFATTASAPMVHIAGVTPEAEAQSVSLDTVVDIAQLRQAWLSLDAADSSEPIGLVSLGNPHFSVTEFARLAALLQGRRCTPGTSLVVACGRAVYEAAAREGSIAVVEAFGATIVTDTCWCMLGEPVVPRDARVLMTNSGKYAHYAPGLTGRAVRFGSLAACAEAACTGSAPRQLPGYLT